MEKSSNLLKAIVWLFVIICILGAVHGSAPPGGCTVENEIKCVGQDIAMYDMCGNFISNIGNCDETQLYENGVQIRLVCNDYSIYSKWVDKNVARATCVRATSCKGDYVKYYESRCIGNSTWSFDSCGLKNEGSEFKCGPYFDCVQEWNSKDNKYGASCLQTRNCNAFTRLGCENNAAYNYNACGQKMDLVKQCASNEKCDAFHRDICLPNCTPRTSQKCIGNEIYHYDSCGNKGELAYVCGKGYICEEKHCVKYCQKNYYKACLGKSSYYFDSCDNKGELYDTCGKNEKCQKGECEKIQEACKTNDSYSCYNGDVYWYDSCGNKEVKKEGCGGRGCFGKECKPDTSGNFSVSVGSYSDAVEKGYYGSLVWSTSGSVKETGVEISYNSNKSDAKKAVSKLNSANSYAALISTESCLSPYIYVRAYAVGSATSQAKYTDWQKITVQQEYCSRNSRVSLMSAPTCSVDSPNCDNGTSLEFSIEEVDLAALGWEGIKLFTIGSCIDEGVLTLGCGFDAGTTVLMIVPESTLAAGASKVANLLSKGSKIVKEARTIAKLSKITKKISLVIEAQKKTMTGIELARAAELGLVKIDFFTGKIYSDFTKLALHYAEKGGVAITRLQKAGATNEMLEAVLRNGGSIEKTINVTKSSKGTVWLEEGTASSGWKHIYEKHIKDIQKGGTKFKDIGITDESQVQKKIFDTVKNPSNTLENSTKTRRCLFSRTGAVGLSYVKVVVGGNGYIITSYPVNNLTCSD